MSMNLNEITESIKNLTSVERDKIKQELLDISNKDFSKEQIQNFDEIIKNIKSLSCVETAKVRQIQQEISNDKEINMIEITKIHNQKIKDTIQAINKITNEEIQGIKEYVIGTGYLSEDSFVAVGAASNAVEDESAKLYDLLVTKVDAGSKINFIKYIKKELGLDLKAAKVIFTEIGKDVPYVLKSKVTNEDPDTIKHKDALEKMGCTTIWKVAK